MIRVEGVGKVFGRPRRSWKDVCLRRDGDAPGPVEALRDVSLTVPTGTALGVVGPNGAGKSTLLRIVAGVLAADTGSVRVAGRVGSMLELGAGFHPDLTGRESAVLAGVVAGRRRREAQALVDAVNEFAGLGDFVDRPLRTYSSGMQARLAFAIATVERPEVLLVDEVLAVGDVAFQQRCIERLRSFQRAGTSLLLVSHDPDLVRLLCDRAVWLSGGRKVREGDVGDVLGAYLAGEKADGAPAAGGRDVGSVLGAVRLLDGRGQECTVLHTGAPLVIEVGIRPPAGARCHVAVRVVRDDHLVCVDTSTVVDPALAGADVGGAVLRLDRLDLAPAGYRVEVGVYAENWQDVLAHRGAAGRFRVLGTASADAALAPPATWATLRTGARSEGFGTD